MVVQGMNSGNSYERKVQEPGEIDDLVSELHLLAEEEGLTRLFLDHEEEPNIVRGRNQRLRHDGRVPEVKRRDGGKTWYHDDTKCFMLGVPDGSDKFRQIYMEKWSELLIEGLEDIGYDAFMEGSDVYSAETGRQLLGLSGSSTDTSTVLRACWYEDTPEIDHLLRADDQDPEEFHDRYETVEGLYERLTDKINTEEAGEEFISGDVLEEETNYTTSGGLEGPCIERYPVKRQTS